MQTEKPFIGPIQQPALHDLVDVTGVFDPQYDGWGFGWVDRVRLTRWGCEVKMGDTWFVPAASPSDAGAPRWRFVPS